MFFIILYYKSNRKLSNKIHITYFLRFILEDTPYKSLKNDTNIEKVQKFWDGESTIMWCGNFTLMSMFQFYFIFDPLYVSIIVIVSSARNWHCQFSFSDYFSLWSSLHPPLLPSFEFSRAYFRFITIIEIVHILYRSGKKYDFVKKLASQTHSLRSMKTTWTVQNFHNAFCLLQSVNCWYNCRSLIKLAFQNYVRSRVVNEQNGSQARLNSTRLVIKSSLSFRLVFEFSFDKSSAQID